MSIVVTSLSVMGTVHPAKQNSGHRQGVVRGQQKRSFLLPQPLANTEERFAVRNRIQFGGLGSRSTAVIEVEDFRAKASLGLNLFFLNQNWWR